MLPLAEVQRLNRELADRINQEARANPASPYAGKFVGIANGQVVSVKPTLREALAEVRRVEPEAARTGCIEASRDYSVVEEVCVVL